MIEFFKKNWGWLKIPVMLMVGLTVLAVIVIQVQKWRVGNDIENRQANINAAKVEAENINTTISNLQLKKVEADANVNAAVKELENVQKDVNAAQANTNAALANVNAVRNGNYAGTDRTEALRALCAAYPEDIQCQ